MNKIKKALLLCLLFIIMLGSISFAYAADTKKQYGKLISVEPTGDGPDSQGRYEYEVTMEINGVTVYLTMWMTEDQYQELKKAEDQMITIYYHWDGHGHRIYEGFKYGNHITGIQHYKIMDKVLYQVHPITGEVEEIGPCY